MSDVQDYLARVEETCGEDRQFIVTFKHGKRAEAKTKILERVKKTIREIKTTRIDEVEEEIKRVDT